MSDKLKKINKVILPVIRKFTAESIAEDIIGVQPMSGPVGQLHTLRAKYGRRMPRHCYE